MVIIAMFGLMNGTNLVKLAHETCEILFYCAAFLSFLEKLESWLERVNKPLHGSILSID